MKKIIPILVALILACCGSPDHAGGSGMEIPNSVTMVALQSDGVPVQYGRVRIVTESNWVVNAQSGKSVVLDSTFTDQNGRFTFSLPDSNRVRIEIISNGEGSSVLFDSTRATVSLAALGIVQAQWIPGATVMIAGTSFSQTADQNGIVNFTSVPTIHSALIGLENGQNPVLFSPIFLKPQETLNLGELQIVNESLVLDNFENKSSSTLLEPFVHGSYWFSIADEHEGGKSTIFPSTANGNSWLLAISDSSALNGSSVTFNYNVQASTSSAAYVIVGCTLGNGINGSAVDSIAFSVNSNGSFVLTNGIKTLFRGLPTALSEWERVVIDRSELDSMGIHSKIELLQFTFTDTTGSIFRLDDFVIYGDPFELLKVE